LSSPNHLGASVPPCNKRKLINFAEKKHHSGKFPTFFRQWVSIIAMACDRNLTPEDFISHWREIVDILSSEK